MAEVKPSAETFAKIKVVGIGGGGGNAINRMIEKGIKGVDFIAINTDVQALHYNQAKEKLHIGKSTTRGLGAGMNPELGKQAAEEAQNEIRDLLKDSDMVFITAGMGGGTGTGAAPVVAEIANDMGALTVAVVTKPFLFEGGQRKKIAERGFTELADKVDTIIAISNDKLLQIIEKDTAFLEAFSAADDVLRQGVQGIAEVITTPGDVNADFADVKTIMSNAGSALMGIGQASGENRAIEAAKAAISSPLLDMSIDGAQGVVFTISGGSDLTMNEVNEAAKIITASADEDAAVIFGAIIDEKLKDEVKITVIATGFDSKSEPGATSGSGLYKPSSFVKKEQEKMSVKSKEDERDIWSEVENKKENSNQGQSNNKEELSHEEQREEKSFFSKTNKAKPAISKREEIIPSNLNTKNDSDNDDDQSDVPAFIRKKMM